LCADHPGWRSAADGGMYRLLCDDEGGRWLASWNRRRLSLTRLTEISLPTGSRTAARATPQMLPATLPEVLRHALVNLGIVVRPLNPSLWDAVATAVIRGAVREDVARTVLRRWAERHGPSCTSPAGTLYALPNAATVSQMSDEDFRDSAMGHFQPALSAAATAVLEQRSEWSALPADRLATALNGLEGVGRWAAYAAAADYTGEMSVHPVDGPTAVSMTRVMNTVLGSAHGVLDPAAAWSSWAARPTERHALTLAALACTPSSQETRHSTGRGQQSAGSAARRGAS
jgi:DNA-3-methyladenine glycosylase II